MTFNETDCHDINEILLKVALSTIKPNQTKLNVITFLRTCSGPKNDHQNINYVDLVMIGHLKLAPSQDN
jgi:hypothetical protein